MGKTAGFTKRITVMLLSGILMIGSASGSVFATDIQDVPEQPAAFAAEKELETMAVAEFVKNSENDFDREAIADYTAALDADGGYFKNERDAALKTVNSTVNKVLKKPGYCHFDKWNNTKYTSCRIAWNKVDGAEGYQTLLSWTDGSHASSTIVKSDVLCRDCTVHPRHVSQMKVRAFYMLNGQRKFGPWSNVEYIAPSPSTLTINNAGSETGLKVNISWNIIYGCNGYNVFVTTDPDGTWYWNQSTSINAAAASAVITGYRGSGLKENTRYYVRIVTRRKRNGVFCTVPVPAENIYAGTFVVRVTDNKRKTFEKDETGGIGVYITKEQAQYANFRNVRAGTMAPNVLYRCINPIIPYSSRQEAAAFYADRLLEKHHVNTVINLSDTLDQMKRRGYWRAAYYKKLLQEGKIYSRVLKDNGGFDSAEKKRAVANAVRVIVQHEGPYVVHCRWGQGRTGMLIMLLESLMGADYDYLYYDFVQSFKNFNMVGKYTSSSDYNEEFSKYMKSITGKRASDPEKPKARDWKNVDLEACARRYLKEGGMTEAEIRILKSRLQ